MPLGRRKSDRGTPWLCDNPGRGVLDIWGTQCGARVRYCSKYLLGNKVFPMACDQADATLDATPTLAVLERPLKGPKLRSACGNAQNQD